MLRIDRLSPPYPVPEGIGRGEFERRIMAEDVEVVGVFGADGRLVLAPKTGAIDAVSFVAAEAPFLRGAVVTHNHPQSTVFSYDDATLVVEHDVRELRAVCPDGVVFVLLRPEEGWPATDAMLAVVETSVVGIREENERRRRTGASILKGRARDLFMFRDQQVGFGDLGVRAERTDVWRR